MVRSIVAVIAGCIVAVIVIMSFEAVGMIIWPPPKELSEVLKDPALFKKLQSEPEALRALMAQIPVAAFLNVLAAHAAGCFVGGWLATRIAKSARVLPGLILGALMTLVGIANLMAIPHPVWFTATDVLIYLPLAFVGAKVAVRKDS